MLPAHIMQALQGNLSPVNAIEPARTEPTDRQKQIKAIQEKNAQIKNDAALLADSKAMNAIECADYELEVHSIEGNNQLDIDS